VHLTKSIADKLLKAVMTLCNFFCPPTAEVVWRESLTECSNHD